VTEIQVFGDSLIINWLIGSFRMEKVFWQPIMEQLKTVEAQFLKISFHHIYREFKAGAYGLSKEGSLTTQNYGLAWESGNGVSLPKRSLQEPGLVIFC